MIFSKSSRKRPIGIIGGAGPMAGLLLCEQVIQLCQQRYNCRADSDFPLVMLWSQPFSNMLDSSQRELFRDRLTDELSQALAKLRDNGAELIAIACNTLHGFLPPPDTWRPAHLVNLLQETRTTLCQPTTGTTLILCSSTSAALRLHASLCDCVYPDACDQRLVDDVINGVCAGEVTRQQVDLLRCLATQIEGVDRVLLGCTELSQLCQRYSLEIEWVAVVDPLLITAQTLCKLSFSQQGDVL